MFVPHRLGRDVTVTTSIELLGHGITVNAVPISDDSTVDAVEATRELMAQGTTFTDVLVDRESGIVLLGPHGNRHITSDACGFPSNKIVSRILAMLGFGSMSGLRTKLDRGDDISKA